MPIAGARGGERPLRARPGETGFDVGIVENVIHIVEIHEAIVERGQKSYSDENEQKQTQNDVKATLAGELVSRRITGWAGRCRG
jgi:hypothetical protein